MRTWSERRKEAANAPKREGFKPLEPGRYNFVAKEAAEVGTAQNTGMTSWNIKLTVEDGPRANATMYHTFYDSEKPGGQAFLLEQFSALGLDSLLDTEPSDEAIAQALLGRRFSAEVYKNVYNGKESMKLRAFRPASGAPVGGALGGPSPAFAAGPGGPSAGPAQPVQQFSQQPVQQAQPPQYQQQAPVQQAAPQPQYVQQPVQQYQPQQYQQPVQQQAPVNQAQQPPAAQQAPADSPWATGSDTPLPQF
jgi:hypothetical protein